jgi:hypothetical protein
MMSSRKMQERQRIAVPLFRGLHNEIVVGNSHGNKCFRGFMVEKTDLEFAHLMTVIFADEVMLFNSPADVGTTY